MPLPLDRPAEVVECTQCHAENRIPAAVWHDTLYTFEGESPPPAGMMHTHNITVESFPLQIQVSNVWPACEQCGTAFPVDELPAATPRNFACTSCGDPASSFPAPDWLQASVRTARQIYTVDAQPLVGDDAAPAAVDTEAPRPVVMACPQCGGSLQITTEHARVTSCQYCSTDVFLPDEVWRRLHPVRTVRWWFVRFEGLTVEQELLQHDLGAQRAKEEAEAQTKQRNAARAWRLMTPAWIFVCFLLGWHVFSMVNLHGVITVDALQSNRFLISWLGLALSALLVGLAGYPVKAASGDKAMVLALIAGAVFCVVPVAGGVLGVVGGAIVLLKKKNPRDPASGVGRPAGAAFILHGIATAYLFIYSVSQG